MISVYPNRATVIDPATRRPLPPGGARVAPSTYWTRRINAGDVSTTPPTKPKQKAPKARKAPTTSSTTEE